MCGIVSEGCVVFGRKSGVTTLVDVVVEGCVEDGG